MPRQQNNINGLVSYNGHGSENSGRVDVVLFICLSDAVACCGGRVANVNVRLTSEAVLCYVGCWTITSNYDVMTRCFHKHISASRKENHYDNQINVIRIFF